MLWIIILFIILFLAWILLSPLEFKIDTRIPLVIIEWKSIGKATLVYEKDEWWLKIHVLFFYKKWSLLQMVFADKTRKKKVKHAQRKKSTTNSKWLSKFFNMLKTFRVIQWKIAISSSDNLKNAWLYPLNFFPHARQHVYINFIDENYLVLTTRNKPLRIIYALMK
jgi:hypothetical protein